MASIRCKKPVDKFTKATVSLPHKPLMLYYRSIRTQLNPLRSLRRQARRRSNDKQKQ